MIWEALAKLALLGTERGQLPHKVQEALGKVGIQTAQAPEAVLLEGAALYHQLRRAGFPLQKGAAATLRPDTAKRPAMPPRAARQMEHVIRGNYRDALPEAFQLTAQAGYALPPEHLPALLYKAARRKNFWKALRPLLEPSDFEFLQLNPDWAGLTECPTAGDWSSLSQETRLQMLRHIRFEQSEKAILYLQECWEELTPPEKKGLLGLLETGLSAADQLFLETQLEDSRKEVRQAAARLLLKIPDTPLQDTIYKEAASWLEVQKDGRLDLHAPKQPVAYFKKLGLYRTKKHKYAGGVHAGQAYDILSLVPPKRWEAHFGKPTLDTLRLFARGNQQILLTDAVANAALLHQDHRWIEALLRHWWRTDNEARWNSALGKALMAALPDAVFNDIMSQYLRQHQGYIEEESFAGQLLCLGSHQWESGVARQVLSNFREWLNAAQSVYWNLWHYKRILQVAAFRGPVSVLPALQTGWNTRAPAWSNWEGDIDRCLKTLAFRKDLQDALAPSKNA
ncbi:MAG: DUF5691 domain-containing protein [Phaeodactylibacter sp.]|uniref:DUF5691 domain-containing protein n=1 Tax=Phaeodactylibacter sp. TaxID=1940289 RepID=UPI0032F03938